MHSKKSVTGKGANLKNWGLSVTLFPRSELNKLRSYDHTHTHTHMLARARAHMTHKRLDKTEYIIKLSRTITHTSRRVRAHALTHALTDAHITNQTVAKLK